MMFVHTNAIAPELVHTHTESETAERICPWGLGRSEGSMCAASRCMAWRWVETSRHDSEGRPTLSHFWRGYCGLAGKPFGA